MAGTETEPLYVEVGCLFDRHLTGMGRFAARLVEALARVAPLHLFTSGGKRDITVPHASLPACDDDLVAWTRRLLRHQRVPHDPQRARRSAAVYTALRPAVRHFRREIGILYDFTALLLSWSHAAQTRLHFGRFFAAGSTLCDKLVAISASTKHDAGWLCAAPHKDVVVAYPGPSLCVHRHAHPEIAGRRPEIILVVSTLEPRKNGPFLLGWFARSAALEPEAELWWVGPKGWWTSGKMVRELTRSRRGGRGNRIRFLGMVSDRRLCALYRQAGLTIYPSLYEGFGLPVLDSLLHETPVLCSFHSSLQEFAGPGVFYFDAGDAASLDAAYRTFRKSGPPPIDADALRRRFSWDVLARRVLALCA